jgi:hypothetical protein
MIEAKENYVAARARREQFLRDAQKRLSVSYRTVAPAANVSPWRLAHITSCPHPPLRL